jgi:Trk K+ transport system NAD-binding subunit
MSSADKPKLRADFSTQCVIVGAGPAGGALASFLASNGESKDCNIDWISLMASTGITGIVISKTSSTALTPRAHITNMAAMG